jgi:hypothetical protein
MRGIKITETPQQAKMIVRGVTHGLHLFSERHFSDICEHSDPHIIAICEEIAFSGKNWWNEERNRKKGGGIF